MCLHKRTASSAGGLGIAFAFAFAAVTAATATTTSTTIGDSEAGRTAILAFRVSN